MEVYRLYDAVDGLVREERINQHWRMIRRQLGLESNLPKGATEEEILHQRLYRMLTRDFDLPELAALQQMAERELFAPPAEPVEPDDPQGIQRRFDAVVQTMIIASALRAAHENRRLWEEEVAADIMGCWPPGKLIGQSAQRR